MPPTKYTADLIDTLRARERELEERRAAAAREQQKVSRALAALGYKRPGRPPARRAIQRIKQP